MSDVQPTESFDVDSAVYQIGRRTSHILARGDEYHGSSAGDWVQIKSNKARVHLSLEPFHYFDATVFTINIEAKLTHLPDGLESNAPSSNVSMIVVESDWREAYEITSISLNGVSVELSCELGQQVLTSVNFILQMHEGIPFEFNEVASSWDDYRSYEDLRPDEVSESDDSDEFADEAELEEEDDYFDEEMFSNAARKAPRRVVNNLFRGYTAMRNR